MKYADSSVEKKVDPEFDCARIVLIDFAFDLFHQTLAVAPERSHKFRASLAYKEVYEASKPGNINFLLERYCLHDLPVGAVEGKSTRNIRGAGKEKSVSPVQQILQGSRQSFYVVSCKIDRILLVDDVGEGEGWEQKTYEI